MKIFLALFMLMNFSIHMYASSFVDFVKEQRVLMFEMEQNLKVKQFKTIQGLDETLKPDYEKYKEKLITNQSSNVLKI